MSHLCEVVISNARLWLKAQASRESTEQAGAFFGRRFTDTDYILDGHLSVTPFRLVERSHDIANWASIVHRLPAGWDDDEFQIEGSPYTRCEPLLDNFDYHGTKGRLDEVFCSDFGWHDETAKRASKSEIVKSGKRIYHAPGGRYYRQTGIYKSQGERWFCTEGEARVAGRRRLRQ